VFHQVQPDALAGVLGVGGAEPARRPARYSQHGRLAAVVTRMSMRAVPGMRLSAIVQRTGNEAAEKYPDVRIVRSLEELLAIREIRMTARQPGT